MNYQIEYREDENTTYLYIGNRLICTLDFNIDVFTDYRDLTVEDAGEYYLLMTKEKEEIEKDDYDVRAEQGYK